MLIENHLQSLFDYPYFFSFFFCFQRKRPLAKKSLQCTVLGRSLEPLLISFYIDSKVEISAVM